MRSNLSTPALANESKLICSGCRATYSVDVHNKPCPKCGGQLLFELDEKVLGKISRGIFRARGWGVWRYRELLPDIRTDKLVSLGEGGTALLLSERLAKALGLRKLLIKDETTNPTGSFLDRGMTVEISRVRELGLGHVTCEADSGNFAASASAYAARAGIKCTIHSQRERIEAMNLGKLYQIIAYGGEVVVEDQEVGGGVIQSETYTLSAANPYFAEGEKTAGYEICEQLGWRTPDRIAVPMGHGEHLSMIWRAINEVRRLGLVEEQRVLMTGVQLESYARIVDQLQGKRFTKTMDGRSRTVAIELAMKNPTHGRLAIQAIRESRGDGVKVKDTEVLAAMSLLAKTEGIFAEPAAASTIAGLRKLVDQGRVSRDEEIVCVITGAGLKDPSTARKFIGRVRQVDRILSQIESRRFTTRLGRTKLEILKIIQSRDTYGYDIWRTLRQKADLELDLSSVYQHLTELENAGLIRRSAARKILGKPERQYYSITEKGRTTAKT